MRRFFLLPLALLSACMSQGCVTYIVSQVGVSQASLYRVEEAWTDGQSLHLGYVERLRSSSQKKPRLSKVRRWVFAHNILDNLGGTSNPEHSARVLGINFVPSMEPDPVRRNLRKVPIVIAGGNRDTGKTGCLWISVVEKNHDYTLNSNCGGKLRSLEISRGQWAKSRKRTAAWAVPIKIIGIPAAIAWDIATFPVQMVLSIRSLKRWSGAH